MTENKPKKRKMNILGYLSIAATLGIMVYSKFTHSEDAVVYRLFDSVLYYGFYIIGAAFLTLLLYIGMYFANMFLNAIYDEDKEPPKWDNADHFMIIFFVLLYVNDLAGWIKIL
jgi:hypothetical protein